jgi:hypothetical protein
MLAKAAGSYNEKLQARRLVGFFLWRYGGRVEYNHRLRNMVYVKGGGVDGENYRSYSRAEK